MIFYLAALQQLSPDLEEAAAVEGASRWYIFRRITFPLLMPTTLFVAINAVINSFKLVDHLVIMTKGGPNNASSLLLYYIYEVAFTFQDTAYAATLTVVLIGHPEHGGADQVRLSRSQDPLSMNERTHSLETDRRLALALLWLSPLAYAFWSAFHPSAYATSFSLSAPWTLENFVRAWNQAPFGRYYLNTILLVILVLAGQLVLSTLAAYAFARFKFNGSGIAFALVLLQLMIMPDVLIVENYRVISALGLLDTIPAIALPYLARAFGIFLLRQTFKSVPNELVDAARVEGAGLFRCSGGSMCRSARPTYVAFGLVSVSYHWNNFLWPLIVTNSVESRPLTVGLAVFGAPETGVDWSVITAATVMTMAPLLIAFLLFQRQFVQSFMRAGIR